MNEPSLSDATLSAIPLLRGMNESERRQIAELASRAAFALGATILHEGQSTRSLWILLEGRCEVIRKTGASDVPLGNGPLGKGPLVKGPDGKGPADAGTGELRLAELEPFENFGEMSFFVPGVHSATVRTLTPVKVLRIERSEYDELVQCGSTAANKLCCNAVESLAQRLRRMDLWVAELLTKAPSHPAESGGNGAAPRVDEWTQFRQRLLAGWSL